MKSIDQLNVSHCAQTLDHRVGTPAHA